MNGFKNIVDGFFKSQKIEYYRVVDYSGLREINPRIRERAGFFPKNAVIFLIPYFVSHPKNFSAYAASQDYHIFVGEITAALISRLEEAYPEYKFAGFGDHSSIDERHAALVSGLGILGDNGLLINEKYGSYVFIADVLTDMPNELLPLDPVGEIKRCVGCKKCHLACPTGKLRSEGSDCLSAITQRKGTLSDFEVKMMRKFDTVWGCDLCQLVCPYNQNAEITPIEFFHTDRVEELTRDYVNALSDEEFEKRAFAWRKRNTVLRNLDAVYPADGN